MATQAKSAGQGFWNKVASPVDADDMEAWRIASNVAQHSKCRAYIFIVCNLFFPGLGTLLCTCMADTVSKTQMWIAFFQGLSAYFFYGWFFAQIWSFLIYRKACGGNKPKPQKEEHKPLAQETVNTQADQTNDVEQPPAALVPAQPDEAGEK